MVIALISPFQILFLSVPLTPPPLLHYHTFPLPPSLLPLLLAFLPPPLQVLPALGVGSEGSLKSQLSQSLPVINQIYEEFQDPVSQSTLSGWVGGVNGYIAQPPHPGSLMESDKSRNSCVCRHLYILIIPVTCLGDFGRTRLRLCVCALRSSSPCTRPSGWFRS